MERLALRGVAKMFWDICLLRRGPQDVPVSLRLFLWAVALSVGLDFMIASASVGAAQALPGVLLLTVMMLGAVYLLLWMLGYSARTVQTLSAIAGTGVVFSAFALPLVLLADASAPQPLAGLALLLIQLWALVVIAHILRHALSIYWVQGGLLALGYFYLNYKLVELLLPIPT